MNAHDEFWKTSRIGWPGAIVACCAIVAAVALCYFAGEVGKARAHAAEQIAKACLAAGGRDCNVSF